MQKTIKYQAFKHDSLFSVSRDEKLYPVVAALSGYDLDILVEQIQLRRVELMGARLRTAGFKRVITEAHGSFFRYLSVQGSPWATVTECQCLLDTRANLPSEQALERWIARLAPMQEDAYTRDDAVRDTINARAELKMQLDAGGISAEMYRDIRKYGTSFMDLVA